MPEIYQNYFTSSLTLCNPQRYDLVRQVGDEGENYEVVTDGDVKIDENGLLTVKL